MATKVYKQYYTLQNSTDENFSLEEVSLDEMLPSGWCILEESTNGLMEAVSAVDLESHKQYGKKTPSNRFLVSAQRKIYHLK